MVLWHKLRQVTSQTCCSPDVVAPAEVCPRESEIKEILVQHRSRSVMGMNCRTEWIIPFEVQILMGKRRSKAKVTAT